MEVFSPQRKCLLGSKKQVQEWLEMKGHDKVQSSEAEIKSDSWFYLFMIHKIRFMIFIMKHWENASFTILLCGKSDFAREL